MQKPEKLSLLRRVVPALGAALACSALALLPGCTRPEAEVTPPSKADAPKQPSKDDAKAEVNPHPIADVRVDGNKRVLTCVVNGKPVRLDFDTDVPEDERDPFSADFALADVTGDGVDELLVRRYVWGNTYSETWSTGYVYEAKDGELKEVLRIPPEGFGRWQPKYPNNLGICPGPGGTLAIEAGTDKDDGELDAKSFLLTRQGGEWTVKDAPKDFECPAPAPAGAPAAAMSDEDFFKLCEKGTAEQVKQALADGANPNAKDGEATVLAWAALNDNLPAVQALLDAGANPNRERPGETALMFAALANNPAMVQALLKAGANPNAKTASGHTALTFWARRHGNLMLDVQQMPPGHAQVVKALLAAGADVNGACSDDAERQCLVPLELEVEVGCDPATVQALLDGGAGKRGRELEQALMLAAWRCAPEGLDVLLKAGASPNTKVEEGETVLMRAARLGKPGNVAALLKAGADASAKDKEGHDALWHARHPDMTAGASEADLAETVRLLQGGAKKPAAQDAGDFSAADLKRMSTFVSEVTGVFGVVSFRDFDIKRRSGDNHELIYFGIEHNFIHNRASRIKPCPEEGCKYGNAVMEAKFVAEAAKKYFDLEVKHRGFSDTESPAPLHFDGKSYHFDTDDFSVDDGPAVHYAEVTRAVQEGGVIRMTGNIYQGSNAGVPPRITDSFVVTAKPHKWNGKDTWAILSLKMEDQEH